MAKKVFLSAGHGGKDPGAVGNGLKEKDINLQIMLGCKSELERHGVIVICSRLKDENDPVGEEVREANASGATVAVSFHTNSDAAGKGDGSESYYYKNSAEGKRLAELCEKYIKELGQNSRGVKCPNLYFTRKTKMTAVLCECAFIKTAKDIAIVDTVEEQQAFGKAYAKAILEYLGITYKAVSVSRPVAGKKEDAKVEYAKSFSESYAGTYTVKANDGLNMRAGANTKKVLIKDVPNGAKVKCYGYYTKESDETVWLLCTHDGCTGFMSKAYLKK